MPLQRFRRNRWSGNLIPLGFYTTQRKGPLMERAYGSGRRPVGAVYDRAGFFVEAHLVSTQPCSPPDSTEARGFESGGGFR